MLYGFGSHHGTHIGSAGRVADIACAAAYQNDRLVACHLKSFHKAERHKVPYVKRVRRRVKAYIEGCFTGVYKLAYLIFVCYLSY